MKNIKISLKLLLLTSISSVIMVVIGIYGLKSLTVVNNGMETMYHDRVVPLKQLKLVSDAYAVNVVDAVNKANSDIISWKKALRELDKAQLIISENWTSYLKTKIEGDERRLVEEAQKIMDNSSSEAISHAYDLFSEGKDSLSIIELNRFVRENLYRDIEPLTDKVTQLIDLQLEISDQIQQQGMTTYNSTVYSLWAILIIGILAGILFSFYLVKQINGSITLANNVVHKMAKGDLSEEFISLSNDEIGVLLQNLERMRLRLQDIISNIVSSSNNIVTASKELSSTSQELSRGAGEQAVSAEEASSSIEEMESNIQQNAENSSITERIAYNASSKIEESNRASAEVIDVMLLISEKISIINDIADKTDLLAINAAVEAARADENGKGFAVIAAEVRSLAERSANASKEIEEVSKKGVLAAQKAGKLLTEVVPEIQKTSSLIQEISVSSAEQSSGTKQISTAIQQLNQVTQQNAAVAEEMATSSEELSSQAELMKDIMSFFNVSQKYVTRKVNRKENLNITTKQPAKVIEKDGIDLDLGPEQSDDDYQKF